MAMVHLEHIPNSSDFANNTATRVDSGRGEGPSPPRVLQN